MSTKTKERDPAPETGELGLEDTRPELADIMWPEFVMWEAASRDTIDLKKVYIDMADGDIPLGVWLSQQVYWELPNKKGDPRTTIEIDGKFWVAKGFDEWWQETRIKEKPLHRCIQYWVTRGVIESETHTYKKQRMRHTRIIQSGFLQLYVKCLQATYMTEQVASRGDGPASREFLLLQRIYRDNVRNFDVPKPKKPSKKKISTDVAAPKRANLVGEFIDECTRRGFDQKPGPIDIGMLGQMAGQGVTRPEFAAMMGCAPSQFRLSVSYLHRHMASLRDQARKSGLYKIEEPPAKNPAVNEWEVICHEKGCKFVLTLFDSGRPPPAVCGHDKTHGSVEVRFVNS